jgi:hypothetical protein
MELLVCSPDPPQLVIEQSSGGLEAAFYHRLTKSGIGVDQVVAVDDPDDHGSP